MWLPLLGFEGLYEINKDNRVRNARTQRRVLVNSNAVTLSKQGKIHRVKLTDLKPNAVTPEPQSPPAPLTRIESAQANFGPWAPKNTAQLIGDAGQHLVCFELARRGIRCATNILEGAPYDVIGDFGSGRLFTVQVKSCAAPVMQGNSVTPGYHFRFPDLNFDAVDLIAFAALDKKAVYIAHIKSIHAKNKLFAEPGFLHLAEANTEKTLLKLYEDISR